MLIIRKRMIFISTTHTGGIRLLFSQRLYAEEISQAKDESQNGPIMRIFWPIAINFSVGTDKSLAISETKILMNKIIRNMPVP